jgi:hypothetical protein
MSKRVDTMIVTDKYIFEYIADKLLAQNARSMFPDKKLCAYRGDNGMKCAIGHVIADEHYAMGLEGSGIEGVIDIVKKSNPEWVVTEDSMEMLRLLQNVHDVENPENWGKHFALIADNFQEDGSFYYSNMIEDYVSGIPLDEYGI